MKITVIGAGVMGSWTAVELLKRGHEVTLVEAILPGHARSSSGGESRLIRGIYGRDTLYMDWVKDSMLAWKNLQDQVGEKLFHPIGTLWMFGQDSDYGDFAYQYLQSINWPINELSIKDAQEKYPQINFDDISKLYYEPESGYLMARRGCQVLLKLFQNSGGNYINRKINIEEENILSGRHPINSSDYTVLACGPWLKYLFPELLGERLQISRQEIYYFSTEDNSDEYHEENIPSWIDLSRGNYYGVPFSSQRDFKIADDTRRKSLDIYTEDRIPISDWIEESKKYLMQRFPKLGNPILSEARVCQYTNTFDGHFLFDFVPGSKTILIAGGGGGHAFKLGPSIGKYLSDMIEQKKDPTAMFGLARLSSENEFKSQFKRGNSFY